MTYLAKCFGLFCVVAAAATLAMAQASAAPAATAPTTTAPATSASGMDETLPPGAVARLGSLSFRHPGQLTAVDVSADGKRIATGGRDQTVRVWDLAGRRLWETRTARAPLAVALSPDGKAVYWVCEDGTAASATVGQAGARSFKVDQRRAVAAEFSADRSFLASAGFTDGVQVWDMKKALGAKTGLDVMKAEGFGGFGTGVALSRDGQLLAAAGQDNQAGGQRLRVYRVADGNMLWEGGVDEADATGMMASAVPAFSLDGSTLAVAMGGKRIALFDAKDGKERSSIPTGKVTDLRYAAAGLFGVAGGAVVLWDPNTGKELWKDRVRSGGSRLSVSADGSVVVVGGWGLWTGGSGTLAEVWTRGGAAGATTAPVYTHQGAGGHGGPVTAVAFTPKGEVLSGGRDGTILRWTGAQAADAAPSGETLGAVMSISGEKGVALTVGAENVLLWDLAQKKVVSQLSVGQQFPFGGTIRPDGLLVALGNAEGITFHYARTGKVLHRIETGNAANLPGVAPAGAAKLMPAAPSWLHVSLAFSPDGRWLASGGYGLRVYEMATGGLAADLADRNIGMVQALAFSPGGRMLAVGVMGKNILLWDFPAGRELERLQDLTSGTTALAFSPDGQRLASGGPDTTTILWDVKAAVPATSQPAGGAIAAAGDLERNWKELADGNAEAGWKAYWSAVAAGPKAAAFLKERLKPVPAAAGTEAKALIAQLDAENFKVRDDASRKLAALGEAARGQLEDAAKKPASDEVRGRLSELLGALASPILKGPEALRQDRAVGILEAIGSAGARAVLESLAAGGPGRLTDAARASLARLKAGTR